METTTALTVTEKTITALDQAAACGMLAQNEVSQFKRMFAVAGAMENLKNLLTPELMHPVMALQNSAIGFRTDKPQGYPVDVVKECLIEATLKGVYPVGNEFNIIAGRCYITKEGFGHKLRDIPNFSWAEIPGIPRTMQGGAIIKFMLEWKHNGNPGKRELEICVRVNNGMGTDAIIGKATRKARAWLYGYITGQEIGEGDAEDTIVDVPIVESKFEQKEDIFPAKVEKSDLEQVADALKSITDLVTAEQVKDYVEGCGEIFAADMVIPNLKAIVNNILDGRG